MKMTKMIAAVAALSMAATPALAAPARNANAASPLSVSKAVRASAPTKGASKLADGPTTITALLFGGLAVAGIVVAIANSGDDSPDSP
jgi:hypothetical protein